MVSSSPVSLVLYEEEDFEVEFDMKLFKDSQMAAGSGITPSQVDPLYEFSQIPADHQDEYSASSNSSIGDDFLVEGSLFNNTQMTDLKDDYSDNNVSDNFTHDTDENESSSRYGTDGYVRFKIPEVSETFDPSKALDLIRAAKRIVIVSGAGISVSAGIPDFRSEGRGLYALLDSFLGGQNGVEAEKLFGGLKPWQLEALRRLDEPESLFDLEFFMHDPHPFYAFLLATRFGAPSATALFSPTPSHHVLAALPNLLLAFTQNIDTLEAVVGLAQVCYCHGSFESVSCVRCKRQASDFWKQLEIYAESASSDISANIPLCQYCSFDSSEDEEKDQNDSLPLLKPDIVFFGESLPVNFFAHVRSTLPLCDLLIVTGSSMKVLPVGSIPDLIPPSVPQILINRERILDHNFDLELLGDADCIWSWIARELKLKCPGNLLCPRLLHSIEAAIPGTFIFKQQQQQQ